MGKEKEKAAPSRNAPKPELVKQEELDKVLEELSARSTFYSGYVDDIRRMLAYCRNNGIAVSKAVQAFHSKNGAVTASALEKVLKLHEQLCALIVPATPRSLAATDFWQKRAKGDFRKVATKVLFLTFLAVAVLGLACYVLQARQLAASAAETEQTARTGGPNSQAGEPNDPAQSDPNEPSKRSVTVAQARDIAKATQTSYLCAAILGAALSGLFTMQHYIRARTFEPNYCFVYLIRLAVGAVAGVVLANFGAGLFEGSATIAKLGPSGIALLGGYSAEAVRQILDRLVQVLVTVVRGRDLASEKLAVAQELLSIADRKAGEAGKSEAIESAVTDLIKNPEK